MTEDGRDNQNLYETFINKAIFLFLSTLEEEVHEGVIEKEKLRVTTVKTEDALYRMIQI